MDLVNATRRECFSLLRRHLDHTQAFLHLYLHFTVEQITILMERYVLAMFSMPMLDGCPPKTPNCDIKCICDDIHIDIFGNMCDKRHRVPLCCHKRSRYPLIESYGIHRYWCARCGQQQFDIEFDPFVDIHSVYERRSQQTSITTRLHEFETLIRQFVLRYVRREFETWLKEFLIVDLVDLVGLYLYIERNAVSEVNGATKKRKIM